METQSSAGVSHKTPIMYIMSSTADRCLRTRHQGLPRQVGFMIHGLARSQGQIGIRGSQAQVVVVQGPDDRGALLCVDDLGVTLAARWPTGAPGQPVQDHCALPCSVYASMSGAEHRRTEDHTRIKRCGIPRPSGRRWVVKLPSVKMAGFTGHESTSTSTRPATSARGSASSASA